MDSPCFDEMVIIYFCLKFISVFEAVHSLYDTYYNMGRAAEARRGARE